MTANERKKRRIRHSQHGSADRKFQKKKKILADYTFEEVSHSPILINTKLTYFGATKVGIHFPQD